jgi:transcriptional regulator with XRE-family HTH domain
VYNKSVLRNDERSGNMSNIGNKEILAKNLVFYLRVCGKEQKEVAKAIGVATSTFNDWVKGKKYPRIDKIEMLSNYFGIKKSDLIEDKKETASDDIELTEGERILIELFRKLPDEAQKMYLEVLRTSLKSQS